MLLHPCAMLVLSNLMATTPFCLFACLMLYTHKNCLIKFGHDKLAKKIQFATSAWLGKVLHRVAMHYFCPNCIPSFSTLKETAQQSSAAIVNADITTVPAKPLHSKYAAWAPIREVLKDIVTEVIQSHGHKVVQNTAVVLLGVLIG